MSTLTEYLAQAKKRLAVTCDRRNILKREYDPLFFNFEAACDDLYKLIRIVEIQRGALNEIMFVRVNNPQIDMGDLALHNNKVSKAAIQAADEIASET